MHPLKILNLLFHSSLAPLEHLKLKRQFHGEHRVAIWQISTATSATQSFLIQHKLEEA